MTLHRADCTATVALQQLHNALDSILEARQACLSQILYLKNSTKITSNTETAMLSTRGQRRPFANIYKLSSSNATTQHIALHTNCTNKTTIKCNDNVGAHPRCVNVISELISAVSNFSFFHFYLDFSYRVMTQGKIDDSWFLLKYNGMTIGLVSSVTRIGEQLDNSFIRT